MTVKYCLPIISKSMDEALKVLQENISLYHYFEFWLDYIEGLEQSFVTKVCQLLNDRAIFLFRRLNLEKPQMDQGQREGMIDLIARSSAYLDIDLTKQTADLRYQKSFHPELKTIVSYHNYKETPAQPLLEEVLSQIRATRPTICKIATFCNTQHDALRLLQLVLSLRAGDDRFLILGMGDHGKITRIFGSLWGNEMAFAPLERSKASAPGQLTMEELKSILEILDRS